MEALLAEIATLLLDGLLTRCQPMDFAHALAQLEVLQIAAWYTEAGIGNDDPLHDPAGRTVVSVMWQAMTHGLADEEWERIAKGWRDPNA